MSEDVINKVLKVIEKESVDYADLRLENSLMTQIRTVNGKVEQSTTGVESGLGLRILKDGAWGFSYGPIEEYIEVVKMAIQANKLNLKHKKEEIKLVKIKVVEDKFEGEQKKKLEDVGFDEKINMTLEADKAQEDERIKSRTSAFREVLRRVHLVTTEGTNIEFQVPYVMMFAQSVARESDQTIEGRSRFGHLGGLEVVDIRSPQEMGETAKERALEGLKAPKVKGGKYPVVLDGTINHLFSHEAAGHSAEGDFVQTAGVLRGKLNKKVASSLVNLIDDGSLIETKGVRSFGYIKYDDEGVPGQKNFIIKDGILETYITDRQSADYFDLKPTGNSRAEAYNFPQIVRMTNTYIAPAKDAMNSDELLEQVKNGFLLMQGGGGQVDPIKGTFNFGVAELYEIKNGEIGQRFRPTTIAGNTLETLNKITGISSEMGNPLDSIGFCGKDGQSAPVGVTAGWLAVKNIVVG
ncbi:MAG: TldD/PmbA family protein [Candidatus Heimdallarchaeota archaeon]|nr:TldD/PmbA family protein [Candidatus Heimdallarchaeota archaeon]MCK4954125.1 TldD/PmbA family protein [Candidatus Heimdallarchaeota archaeon]